MNFQSYTSLIQRWKKYNPIIVSKNDMEKIIEYCPLKDVVKKVYGDVPPMCFDHYSKKIFVCVDKIREMTQELDAKTRELFIEGAFIHEKLHEKFFDEERVKKEMMEKYPEHYKILEKVIYKKAKI